MGRGKCNRQEPRNLEPRKLILEAESYFSQKFAPPKITHYTVAFMRSEILTHLSPLSSVRFVLYTALFAHHTVKRAFCALYGTFCTSYRQACVLCSIRHFLHIIPSSVRFVLYTALFAHHTVKRAFCALYGTFCTSYRQAYILC